MFIRRPALLDIVFASFAATTAASLAASKKLILQ
jgi:hypothetical protein